MRAPVGSKETKQERKTERKPIPYQLISPVAPLQMFVHTGAYPIGGEFYKVQVLIGAIPGENVG